MITPFNIFKLDPEYDGYCPCLNFKLEGIKANIHCWRANCAEGCEFSGIHVIGSEISKMAEIGEETLKQLEKTWSHTEWVIKYIIL